MKQLLTEWYRQNTSKRYAFNNKMANTFQARSFLQNEENHKDDNQSHIDTNMEKTKE